MTELIVSSADTPGVRLEVDAYGNLVSGRDSLVDRARRVEIVSRRQHAPQYGSLAVQQRQL
jgi:hypothetical protein